MEVISSASRFPNSSLKTEIYDKQNYTFGGRSVYYSDQSISYAYATEKGFWVVILKQEMQCIDVFGKICSDF